MVDLQKKDKLQYENELKTIISLLQLDNNSIILKGSASIKNQLYYSDFDLFSPIEKKYTIVDLYDKLKSILNRIYSNTDVYFIELKIHKKNDEKIKFFPNDKFSLHHIRISEIDFIKIDCVISMNYKFIETSIIYQFNNKDPIIKNYGESILKDITAFKQEHNYFKVLKRGFKLAVMKQNKKVVEQLLTFFNGKVGQLYQEKSNLEAMKLLLNYYHDEHTEKKCSLYLTLINETFSLKDLDTIIQTLNDYINKKSLPIISELNL